MAVTNPQFVYANTISGSTVVANITATQAGDQIVCAGYNDGSVTCNSITTNNGNTGIFQTINGSASPVSVSLGGPNIYYYVSIVTPSTGTTSVTVNYSGTPGEAEISVWVVRGTTAFSLDKSNSTLYSSGTDTSVLSGVTGTLSQAVEFVIGADLTSNAASSQDLTQTGSASFTQDSIGAPYFDGYHHKITATNATVQSAWNQGAGESIVFCCAFLTSSGAVALTASNLAAGAAGFANSKPVFAAFTPIWLNTWVLDNGLLGLDANSDSVYICSQQPVDFTTATVTYGLGSYSFGVGNVFPGTPANASPNGRVITSSSVVSGNITANGTPTYWAIVDTANSRLLATGPLSGGVPVVSGNQFTLSAITVHIPSQ